eukprot:3248141-Pyramimonas_sp.AAC.1
MDCNALLHNPDKLCTRPAIGQPDIERCIIARPSPGRSKKPPQPSSHHLMTQVEQWRHQHETLRSEATPFPSLDGDFNGGLRDNVDLRDGHEKRVLEK